VTHRHRRAAIAIGLLIAGLGAPEPVRAKRRAPAEVKAVIQDGVRYVVPHFGALHGKKQNGGYVQARRADSDELLWDRMVYSVSYDEKLERDAQDVFITGLTLKGGALLVENELGETFEMDLGSGACKAVGKKSDRTAVVGVEAASACEALVARATPKDWRRVEQRDGFVLFLPPSCAPDSHGPRFVHGGSRWRCGTVSVELVWGMWGAGTAGKAGGADAKECPGTLAGVPVLFSMGGSELRRAVWYRTGYVHEPIVEAWSSIATDIPVLEAITRSGLLAGPRGPNR
jgi:hypothetical protein